MVLIKKGLDYAGNLITPPKIPFLNRENVVKKN